MRSWTEEAAAKSGRGLCILRGNGSPSSPVVSSPHNPTNSGALGPESPRNRCGLWGVLLNEFGRHPAPYGAFLHTQRKSRESAVSRGLRKARMFGPRPPLSSVVGHLPTRLLSVIASFPPPTHYSQGARRVFLKLLTTSLQTPPYCS